MTDRDDWTRDRTSKPRVVYPAPMPVFNDIYKANPAGYRSPHLFVNGRGWCGDREGARHA